MERGEITRETQCTILAGYSASTKDTTKKTNQESRIKARDAYS